MAFNFNDLGKKITDTTHSVVEKTKSSTDTLRLNNQINEEERNINAAYLNMGKRYADLHKDAYEPEFAEFFAQIAQSEEKIQAYRVQIRKNKHLILCENCGSEIAETVLYCTKCGVENPVGRRLAEEKAAREAAQQAEAAARAAAKQSYTVEVCPNCGAPKAVGAVFCTTCGKPFGQPAASTEKTCPHCGKVLQPGARFCTGCGMQIGETPVSQPVEVPAEAVEVVETPVVEPIETVSTVPETTPEEVVETTEPVTSTPVAEAEETAKVAEKICPNCGKALTGNERFCTGCGAKLVEEAAERICKACGKPVPAQNRFCTNCGASVE